MNTTSAIGDDQSRELADESKRQADAAIAARETGFVATVVDGDAVIGRPNCGRSTRRIRRGIAPRLLDASRASRGMGCSPGLGAWTVRHVALAGMQHRDADATPVLRRHGVASAMRDLVTRGPVIQLNRPQTAARNAR